ncbi:DUF58 domain-containing protein [Arthrobacter rhombi]|uniref:DUF58 domain-containing protein n=1 Tax=Arthrobacter rhombi TaxID=71253 RepID=UPI003F8E8117
MSTPTQDSGRRSARTGSSRFPGLGGLFRSRRASNGPRRTQPTEKKHSRLHPASLTAQVGQLIKLEVQPLWQRLSGWALPRIEPATDVVSPLGWLLAAVVVALAVLGGVFGWQEARIAALMGALLLLLAIAFILGRSVFRVTLDLNRTRVAVGDRAVGGLEVQNASTKALLPVAMELPVGTSTAFFRIPRLAPVAVHEELFTIPTHRRAVIAVGPVRSIRQDPFGLLRRQIKWTEVQDLFVHPRTTALGGTSSGFIKDLEGEPTRVLSSSDVSFHALRDYVPGDDRRHIHWKTTARTGELMVRQFEETRRSHLAIALSTNTAEYVESDDFELAVSVAASIGLQAVREQRNLSVLTQAGPLRTQTGRNLLDDCTRVEGTARRNDLIDLSRTTNDAVPNASVFFLITGTAATPAQLRRASTHVPVGVRAFAVRCGTGAEPARASIGDLTVITVGQLSELPLILHQVAS